MARPKNSAKIIVESAEKMQAVLRQHKAAAELCACEIAYWRRDDHDNPVLIVQCNDAFPPDHENETVPLEDTETLLRAFNNHGMDGVVIWIARKRQSGPMHRYKLSERIPNWREVEL